ncbi:MAG: nucleoside triphosphate pyrophosphohydrolase [Rhodospirillales bacterium]|nr:nucleoside triphosphate pyrophosphohydrolase [Rhodospirillales bacterium]
MSEDTRPADENPAGIDRLLAIMARLRHPQDGCPWDVVQTFATIAPHTIEEAYEVADAIGRNDLAGLKEELGDLLLQVVFHARMAEEQGAFDFAAVVAAISDKLVRRHPHVFADAVVESAEAQTLAWEQHKQAERVSQAAASGDPAAGASALHGVALALPALVRAAKLQARAAQVGFDWPDAASALPKIGEELAELASEMGLGISVAPVATGDPAAEPNHDRLEDELGDLLFACVNVARKLKIDAETALRRANAKFERRFAHIEARLAADGLSAEAVDLVALERLWREAKASERPT